MFRFVTWLLALLRREHFEIGRLGNLYLTRWTLLGERFGPGPKLFLHYFHRSDGEDLHDHPWPFWSLVLWPGYWEETSQGTKWHGPLSLLRRPAVWRHRVVLQPGRNCWSLVWTGTKERSWGFWCRDGWRPWREHAAREEAGLPGCGD